MGPIDALWHLLNFFGPAVGVGLISAGTTKLLWRKALARVSFARLAAFSCGAAAVVSLGGLIVLGRDGQMPTYALIVVGCAVALWWAAFGPRRG